VISVAAQLLAAEKFAVGVVSGFILARDPALMQSPNVYFVC
jgi:hypothetical protein